MILTINNEQYQLRRFDVKNLVIERLQKPKDVTKEATRWEAIGYYGKLDDLVAGLLKLTINLPEIADSINMDVLRAEIKEAENTILEAIERCQLDCTSSQGQSDREITA